jgi:hypothetical protein
LARRTGLDKDLASTFAQPGGACSRMQRNSHEMWFRMHRTRTENAICLQSDVMTTRAAVRTAHLL